MGLCVTFIMEDCILDMAGGKKMPCSTPTAAPSALAETILPTSKFWGPVPELRRGDLLNYHLKRALEVVGRG